MTLNTLELNKSVAQGNTAEVASILNQVDLSSDDDGTFYLIDERGKILL